MPSPSTTKAHSLDLGALPSRDLDDRLDMIRDLLRLAVKLEFRTVIEASLESIVDNPTPDSPSAHLLFDDVRQYLLSSRNDSGWEGVALIELANRIGRCDDAFSAIEELVNQIVARPFVGRSELEETKDLLSLASSVVTPQNAGKFVSLLRECDKHLAAHNTPISVEILTEHLEGSSFFPPIVDFTLHEMARTKSYRDKLLPFILRSSKAAEAFLDGAERLLNEKIDMPGVATTALEVFEVIGQDSKPLLISNLNALKRCAKGNREVRDNLRRCIRKILGDS